MVADPVLELCDEAVGRGKVADRGLHTDGGALVDEQEARGGVGELGAGPGDEAHREIDVCEGGSCGGDRAIARAYGRTQPGVVCAQASNGAMGTVSGMPQRAALPILAPRGGLGHGLWGFVVGEPSQQCGAREPPLPSERTAGQLARDGAGVKRLDRQAQQRGGLPQRQHLLAVAPCELYMTDRELVGEQLAYEMLLTAPGRVNEPVQRGGLLARQPDEQWNAILGHAPTIARCYRQLSVVGASARSLRPRSPETQAFR